MSRPSTPWALAFAVVVAGMLGSAGLAHAWGIPPRSRHLGPPDQSWLADAPERPGARPKPKLAVFELRGDDVYQPVRAAVVRLLRRRGFNVLVSLRPVESAVEYRDMSHELGIVAYVEGELKGEGDRQTAQLTLVSGVTGRRWFSARFSGPTAKIVDDVSRDLWKRVGPAITRARASAARPRKREHDPLVIDVGDPSDS